MSTRPTLTLKRPLLKRDAKMDISGELQGAMRPIVAGPLAAAPEPTPPNKQKKPRPRPDAAVSWHSYHFVWSPSGFKPTRRHATEETALAQAASLRERFPLQRFHVYFAQCVRLDDRPEGGPQLLAAAVPPVETHQ